MDLLIRCMKDVAHESLVHLKVHMLHAELNFACSLR